jgi:NADP-dependent 3-hydroxy acid dehydrogenase YdfG
MARIILDLHFLGEISLAEPRKKQTIRMKKVIIMGASSGIGRSLARLFAENEYLVGVTGRRTELLNQLQRERPQSYLVRMVDVADPTLAVKSLEYLSSQLGGLDLVIICAGNSAPEGSPLKQECYSSYKAQVILNIQNMGLTWEDSMDAALRQGAAAFPFISMNC